MGRKITHYKQSVRHVLPSDIEHIAKNMRQADIDELKAAYGDKTNVRGLLKISVNMTPDPVTILCPSGSGEPIALLGTIPPSLIGDGLAKPWMLGTDSVFKYPRAIVKGGQTYVKAMLERYGSLENFVDVRNKVSTKWLKTIGFTLEEPKPYGPYDMPFHRFFAEGIHAT